MFSGHSKYSLANMKRREIHRQRNSRAQAAIDELERIEGSFDHEGTHMSVNPQTKRRKQHLAKVQDTKKNGRGCPASPTLPSCCVSWTTASSTRPWPLSLCSPLSPLLRRRSRRARLSRLRSRMASRRRVRRLPSRPRPRVLRPRSPPPRTRSTRPRRPGSRPGRRRKFGHLPLRRRVKYYNPWCNPCTVLVSIYHLLGLQQKHNAISKSRNRGPGPIQLYVSTIIELLFMGVTYTT